VKELRRRYLAGGWWPTQDEVTLFKPAAVSITRYRYRHGAIPSPWTVTMTEESTG
jgi:RNA-directed DNA polymerase